MKRPLVSVIVPVYNCERFIAETIESVLSQTMSDFELLLVDDCSVDASYKIIESYRIRDSRIRVFRQSNNLGAASARNKGLAESRGRFIAYLDSDDLWMPRKLDKQVSFMAEHHYGACFTAYETINEDGSHRNYVKVPSSITYKGFLKNPVTCSHSILFDTELVDRQLLHMPNLKRGQDAATWLQVLKRGHRIYGLNEVLAKNRKRRGSLSSNKIRAVKRTWYLYRNVEKLPLLPAVYYLSWQLAHAVIKRVGRL